MRKIVAAINMTVDGFCDHTAIIPDDEIHQHYTELLRNADTILYGRKTFQLMEYWQTIVKNPTGNKAMDEFALVMDRIPKIVFSHTLKTIEWETAKLATKGIKEEATELKQQTGGDILVGSPGLIISMAQLGLIGEFQLCVHPVIAGKGLPLFKNIGDRIMLELINTKTFASGAIVLYYMPEKEK
jgi:dihydrofolate reductase